MLFHFSHRKIVITIVSLLLASASVSNAVTARLRAPTTQGEIEEINTEQRRSYDFIACGQTVTQDTVLANNVVDCDCGTNGFALKINGTSLDLNGHSVSCKEKTNNNACIQMVGNSPRVYSSQEGAALTGCGRGIDVSSAGTTTTPTIENVFISKTFAGIYSEVDGATIKNVIINDSDLYGVYLRTSDNVIESTEVLGTASGSCIYVNGDGGNEISNSVVKNCGGDCINIVALDQSRSEVVKNNVIESCKENGIIFERGIVEDNYISETGSRAIAAIDVNPCRICLTRIRNNKIEKSGMRGYTDSSLRYAITVEANTVVKNNIMSEILGGGGIWIKSDGQHTIRNNQISDCQDDAYGLWVEGSGDKVIRNVVKRCNAGVYVKAGAVNNVIEGNTVTEPVGESDLDFVDGNVGCANNTYIDNIGRFHQDCNNQISLRRQRNP